jgi:uncharacterized paraquat-inducible protein A
MRTWAGQERSGGAPFRWLSLIRYKSIVKRKYIVLSLLTCLISSHHLLRMLNAAPLAPCSTGRKNDLASVADIGVATVRNCDSENRTRSAPRCGSCGKRLKMRASSSPTATRPA